MAMLLEHGKVIATATRLETNMVMILELEPGTAIVSSIKMSMATKHGLNQTERINMQRISLVAIFLFLMASSLSAECVTNKNTTMYFEMDRLLKVAKVTAVSEQQGLAMIVDDMQKGIAVGVPRGTRIDSVRRIISASTVSVVKIKGITLISLTNAISCRHRNDI